jgi:hypothetical protein
VPGVKSHDFLTVPACRCLNLFAPLVSTCLRVFHFSPPTIIWYARHASGNDAGVTGFTSHDLAVSYALWCVTSLYVPYGLSVFPNVDWRNALVDRSYALPSYRKRDCIRILSKAAALTLHDPSA